MRGGGAALFLESIRGGTGSPGGRLTGGSALPLAVILFGFFAGAGRCLASARGREFHSRAAGFRKSDRDGLFGGGCSMLAFADVMHFLAYEFSRLRTGRFPFPCILAGAFDCFSLGHKNLLSRSMDEHRRTGNPRFSLIAEGICCSSSEWRFSVDRRRPNRFPPPGSQCSADCGWAAGHRAS